MILSGLTAAGGARVAKLERPSLQLWSCFANGLQLQSVIILCWFLWPDMDIICRFAIPALDHSLIAFIEKVGNSQLRERTNLLSPSDLVIC